MISENLNEFYNLPVRDFEPGKPLADADQTAYRVRLSWEDYDQDIKFIDRLNALLTDPAAGQLRALVIGDWGGTAEGNDITQVIGALVAARGQLTSLEAIFLADLTSEESEISWIQQGDVSALWSAFPGLIEVGTRGGEGLSLGSLLLPKLRKLVVEAGGLPRSVVQQVATANLPELEHLELWLGTDEYGGDSTAEDVRAILNAGGFPKLNYLGLRNSCIADEVAKQIADSTLVPQLEVLDLSMGTLTDAGAEALASAGNLGHLHKLDIHHHFVSKDGIAKLGSLGIAIDASDEQEADEYGDETYYFVAVSE